MERPEMSASTGQGGGLAAMARVIGAVAVLLLALLAILMVLDVVPRAAFAELSMKLGLVVGIVLLACVTIGVLLRAGRR